MDQRASLKAAGKGAAAIHGLERRTMDKVTWRLLPILIVCFLINYLDRVNVGLDTASANAPHPNPRSMRWNERFIAWVAPVPGP